MLLVTRDTDDGVLIVVTVEFVQVGLRGFFCLLIWRPDFGDIFERVLLPIYYLSMTLNSPYLNFAFHVPTIDVTLPIMILLVSNTYL